MTQTATLLSTNQRHHGRYQLMRRIIPGSFQFKALRVLMLNHTPAMQTCFMQSLLPTGLKYWVSLCSATVLHPNRAGGLIHTFHFVSSEMNMLK